MSEPVRRQRRRILTDKMVAALPRKRKRYILADPEMRGMYIRVPPQGPAVFTAVARDLHSKPVWARIGTADVLPIAHARDKAREAIRRIREGLPAFAPPPAKPDSFKAVAENWLARHVNKQGLITGPQIERCLRRYVFPTWGNIPFTTLGKADLAKLLDYIEDHHGARTADVVKSHISSIASWHAERDDHYINPFLRASRRVPKGGGRRSRTLSDDELRAVWRACEEANNGFGRFMQLLLLTAQRRGALVRMKWSDIDADGVWHMPHEPREKHNAGDLQLSPLALQILARQPRMAGNDYVFAGMGDNAPTTNFTLPKRDLDKASGVSGFVLHDCRRTARSLMSRAGVSSEHAERVMGHVIPGVEGIYNHHEFFEEKAVALTRLAQLITDIVYGPPAGRVVPLRAPAQP